MTVFAPCRSVHRAADFGLGVARGGSGDVCEQPSQWTDHLCWTHSSEQMVGAERFCRHVVCNNLCSRSLSEQVFLFDTFNGAF